MRIRFLAATGLCVIALCATSYTSQAGAAPDPGRTVQAVLAAATTRPAANHVVHPANWAGYAVSGGTYTSASATWTVPAVSNNGQTNSTSYTWVGIDGWSNGRLLRAGVQQGWNASSHIAYHRAFWGMGPSVSVAFNVSVGDSIYASLTQIASNRWSIYLADLNSGRKILKTVEYTGPRQSADFVHSAPGSGELARTTSVSFYNARVNGIAAFASFTNQAVDLMAGGDVLARPSYYSEAHNAFTITDGPDRPAAPVDQVFQRHSDGSIWVSNGNSCQRSPGCTAWQELDNNPATTSIKAGAGTVFQSHKDGSIWEWTGGVCLGNPAVCRNWVELDENAATKSISAGSGSVYQLHKDGSIWQSTGQPCTSATACPGWTELDNNATTVAINAVTFKLYQRHKDGSVWQWTGQPCATATSCTSWEELDANQATIGMSGGVYFYQRHTDGSIWQSTGQPCTSATSCPGWAELDGNPGSVAIAAGLLTVYQLHKDGSVWRSTGVACTSATSCPGWTELDDNQGTVQISVSNGSLAPA